MKILDILDSKNNSHSLIISGCSVYLVYTSSQHYWVSFFYYNNFYLFIFYKIKYKKVFFGLFPTWFALISKEAYNPFLFYLGVFIALGGLVFESIGNKIYFILFYPYLIYLIYIL